jgi:PBP1b-binding outer membrane lipoprotein LpoB
MQRIIITAGIIALFFIGCNKEQSEQQPAPIEYNTPNTPLEAEVQSAERLLMQKIHQCSVNLTNPENPKTIELTRASDPVRK